MILVGSVISSLVNLRPLSEATDEFFWYISGNADGGVGAWMQSVSANDVSCTIIKEEENTIYTYFDIYLSLQGVQDEFGISKDPYLYADYENMT